MVDIAQMFCVCWVPVAITDHLQTGRVILRGQRKNYQASWRRYIRFSVRVYCQIVAELFWSDHEARSMPIQTCLLWLMWTCQAYIHFSSYIGHSLFPWLLTWPTIEHVKSATRGKSAAANNGISPSVAFFNFSGKKQDRYPISLSLLAKK